MLTKHSAWDGVVAPTLGGVLRHGVEIPRSATLEYKSWETLSRENHWSGKVSSNLVPFLGAEGLSKCWNI